MGEGSKPKRPTWSLVLGIIGCACGFISIFVCWWLCFVAIGFGIASAIGKWPMVGWPSFGVGCVTLIIMICAALV